MRARNKGVQEAWKMLFQCRSLLASTNHEAEKSKMVRGTEDIGFKVIDADSVDQIKQNQEKLNKQAKDIT